MAKKEYKQQLHKKALIVAQKYKKCELELIDILEKVDKYKICYSFGYSSLYSYVSDYLGLSKDVAAIFINVARKTRELPALREEIKQGHITVSKARRMTSVINSQNQDHWLKLAKTCSKAQLEKEVARFQPKQAIITKTKYVAAELEVKEKAVIKHLEKEVRVQLQLGVSEKLMLKLRRVQDIVSQKQKKPVDLETTLELMTEAYLYKEDPVKKAQRQKIRGKLNNEKDNASQKQKPFSNVNQQNRTEPDNSNFGNRQRKFHHSNDTKAKISVPGHNADQQSGEKDSLRKEVHKVDKKEATKQKALRKPLTANIKHQVYLKYRGKCGHKDSTGKACNQSRFLEIHHKKPVSIGGTNNLNNLTLLCSGHHKVMHAKQ